MLKKQTGLCVTLSLLALAVLTGYLLLREGRTDAEKRVDRINRNLARQVQTKRPPAPLHLAAAPQKSVHRDNPAAEPTLARDELEHQRAAFSRTRFKPASAAPSDGRSIHLSGRIIRVPQSSAAPQFAASAQTPSSRRTKPYIVHIGRPITPPIRQKLEADGAILRGYLPEFAFLAELSAESLARIALNDDVGYVAEYTAEDKIDPFLKALSGVNDATETLTLSIQTFDPKDVGAVSRQIIAAGGSVESANRLPQWGLVKAVVALRDLPLLANMGEVQWLEESVPVQKLNDFAARTEHVNATAAWNAWHLTGKGQIVGHADTGLDSGDAATVKADFQGQIVAIFDLANGGDDAADYDGHGTHTAGSICGNGALSDGQYRGIAYDAKLVSQCLVNKTTGAFTGISDLYGMYMQSYLAGATIHSDSWGAAVNGQYDSLARITDLFAWTYSDFLPVFAAGNSGRDVNNDGVVDADSLTSPGTAKNVLTVGAAEGDRPFAMEGYRAARYSNKWPTTFKTNPIKDDYISWSATTSPYQQGMAAFSSRGPTDDNRIKPDVVAPGTDIISTRSSVAGAGWLWGILPSNGAYCYSGGTSMATPLTAGSAALVRQYIVERGGIAKPSAALVKAAMIGGARSLAPGQYGTGAAQEIPFSRPNTVEGWGQTDIEQSVHPAGLMIRLIDAAAPSTGETNSYTITVEKPGYPLEIVLCWMDYPGTAGAAVSLINDLNLNVTDPATNALFPNGLSVNDSRNTVESVLIASAAAGEYTLRVIGHNVPVSGGKAALYIRGAIDEPPIIVHQPLPYYDATAAPYPVDFKVQYLNVLTNNELNVFFNTGTALGVTGVWQSVAAAWSSNALYSAGIPQQPKDTTLYYYIALSNSACSVTLPADAVADGAFFRMHLGTPTELVVDGAPEQYGTVAPGYGTNTLLSGEIFTASALPQAVSSTERLAVSDWSGSGDIPDSGTVNPFSQAIYQESSLTWNWQTQYALTRTLYFREVAYTASEGIAWHWKDQSVPAQSTPDLYTLSGDGYKELYVFYGWELDGARWPDGASPSPNPLGGLVMSNAFTLRANYMEIGTDGDGDGLYDWWELRFFGTTNAPIALDGDADGDGWSNLAESLDNTDPHDPLSYPTPPVVAVQPLNPFQAARPPWSVSAAISDNFVVVDAVLQWREKDESLWRDAPMSYQGGGLFSAVMNPPSHGAKRVDYRVIAYDIVGYYDPEFMTVSPVYSVIGDYDTPWLHADPATLGIRELALQPTNLVLSVANLAGPDLVWSGMVASAAHHFAAAHPGWSHSGTNDLWTLSTYRTWNGDPVWYCGSNATRRYPDLCHASLDTPSFTVGDNAVLVFRHWMDFEEYGPEKPEYYWDGAIVMISTNGGASFVVIEPTDGYNGRIEPNPDSPFPGDMPCLGDTGTGWKTAVIDLADFAGSSAFIRFEFGSDRYVVAEGWYIAGATILTTEAPLPPWLTQTGSWSGVLPDTWSTVVGLTINPLLMATNSEHTLCVRFESNDPQANPIIDLTLRRGFAVTGQTSGNGSIAIADPVIFRSETALVDIQADYGSYITGITLNGVLQSGDYGEKDTERSYAIQPVTNDLHFTADFALRSWDLAVTSAHGSPSPAVGLHTFVHGSGITAAVSPLVAGINPMIRYSTENFTLSGATPSASGAGSVAFVLTNHAALTWLWTTNYQMTAASTGNGVVVPPSGWYTAGSSACTTGYPSLYYHFASWSGDTNGASRTGAVITLPMNSPRSVCASFAPNLTPTHGVPEFWLASYGFSGNFDAAAADDQDQDGMATWKEWRADTDPTDGDSLLQIAAIAFDGGMVQIDWIGGVMRTQTLQSAAAPAGPWTPIHTNLPPTPVGNTLQVPRPASNLFFRVAVP